MLYYDNGRFSLGSVSFKLPSGVLIDLKDDEVLDEGFCLYAPNESFNIRIRCTSSKIGAYESLARMLCCSDTDYNLIGEISEVNCNGLAGYKAIYEDSSTLNEEYAFNLTDCGEYDFLDVCVTIDKDSQTHHKAQKDKILKEVLDSIECI